MAVNSAFHTNNLTSLKSERNLYSDLIKEAIQIHGHDVYYMDRQSVAADTIFGEDALNKFNTQHPIEMYIEDGEGYAGDKEIMTQFGLENRNEITFVVHKKRFQEMDRQVQIEDATDTGTVFGVTGNRGTVVLGDLELDTDLEVQYGGTGVSQFVANGIPYGNNTGALQVTSAANMASPGTGDDATTSYQVLTVTSGGVPVWTNTLDGGTF